MSEQDEEKSRVITKVIFMKKKLDKEIGYNYWKKYVASIFWSQISTPINLTITMLTAITTAQIQTNDLVSQSISSQLAIVSLILATLNTFFRPHTQYATNTEFLSKWRNLGVKFEDEYYNNMVEVKNIEGYRKRLASLQLIQKEVNELRQAEGTNTINFLTDFLFFISFLTCLRNKKNWLDRDKAVALAAREKINEKKKEGRVTKKNNNDMTNPAKNIIEHDKLEEEIKNEIKPEEAKPDETQNINIVVT